MISENSGFSVKGDAAFSWANRSEVRYLFELLNVEGDEVRVVGGAVRNALMGAPVSDIDCATTAEPDVVMRRANDAGVRAIPTGIEHGTITLVIDDVSFEITSLRTDVETDGRRAVVAFGRDWAVDAHRRDFTMNALYLDADGFLHDPTGCGVADAKARHVRFIGDADMRIAEDYLRVLRFFRFYAQYGKAFEASDYHACIAAQSQLVTLSAERIGAEMCKLVAGDFALQALDAMHRGGMLTGLVCSVPRLGRLARLIKVGRRLRIQTDLMARLLVLFVEVREDAVRLANVLRLPNRIRDGLIRLCENVEKVQEASDDELLRLAYEHGKDCARNLVLLSLVERRIKPDLTDLSMHLHNVGHWDLPVFPLSGRDLIDRGVKAGPEVGVKLRLLEQAWMDSAFTMSRGQLLLMLANKRKPVS